MFKVVWTERALKDLKNIGEFISKDSLHYARLTLENLINLDSLIAENPKMGRIVPEIHNKDIREIIKGNYRIIYQIRKNRSIYILTVFHTSRLLTEEGIS